jgi:hypothetical protein
MKCAQCNKFATQLHPHPLCDWHWSVKYSYQTINGKRLPFLEAFKLLTKHGSGSSEESQARSAAREFLSTVGKEST